MTYCDDGCKRSGYMQGAWEVFVGELWEPGWDFPFCPFCGTHLLPDGTTEAMVRREVTLEALSAFGRRGDTCSACHVACADGDNWCAFDECCERRLAWAEQRVKEKRGER